MTPAAVASAFVEAIKNDGGLIFVFLFIVVSGIRGAWVFRREVERLERLLTEERVDFMRELGELRTEVESWRRMSLMQQGQHGPEAGHPHESRQGDA